MSKGPVRRMNGRENPDKVLALGKSTSKIWTPLGDRTLGAGSMETFRYGLAATGKPSPGSAIKRRSEFFIDTVWSGGSPR